MSDEKKSAATGRVLCPENISDAVKNAKYAIRGAIVTRAKEISADLESKINENQYPFNRVIWCNIGNPQAFCPPPITFHRQILACVMYPPLMKQNNLFPKDVIARAQRLLDGTAHQSIGAYTNSEGMAVVRESVGQYLKERDGFDADVADITLTSGASAGIKRILNCLTCNKSEGILIPIPQYPLYSATITLLGGAMCPYYLDESNGWNASLKSIEDAIISAQKEKINVKAIVIINPGNPTGQCMTKKTIEGVLDLALKYKFVVLADEVYQENIYDKEKFPFVSFRKCLLGSKDETRRCNVELISFHSVSKGIFGECGLRGGYFETINVEAPAKAMIKKLGSISLCPNTVGQCMVDLMLNHPKKGDESYELFNKEYNAQYESLRRRAKTLSESLNKIDGITCNEVLGAMYAFPQIQLSAKMIENCKKSHENDSLKGTTADFMYCYELLETKGLCVIAGAGFGQKEKTFHFRTTLLPPEEQMQTVVQAIADFHASFVKKYS